MVSQVLDPDKSLSNAVKRMMTWLSAAGAECPSADTGAYSKARQRLSELLLQRLVPETAEQLEQQVLPQQQWCGRRVRVCDGTTVLMSDSAAFPGGISPTWEPNGRLWVPNRQTGGHQLGCSRVRWWQPVSHPGPSVRLS